MTSMTISRLAAAAGVGIETIRFYQRQGLLRVPSPSGAVRHYDTPDVERLRFIRAAQRAGFRLAEIAALLRLDPLTERDQIRTLAQARLDHIDEQIATLSDARNALTRLVSDCARGDTGPCPIITAFN